LLVGGVSTLLVSAVLTLAEPADKWISEAPRQLKSLKKQAGPATGRLEDIKKIAEEVEGLSEVEPAVPVAEVVVQESSALDRFLVNLPSRIASLVLIFFLSFFLLACGQDLLKIVTRLGRTVGKRRRIIVVALHIEKELSSYLGTVALINAALGLATGIAMYLMDVPNPFLWGVTIAVLNFAPYVGALASLAVLGIVGFTTFGSTMQALSVPGVFLVLTTLEGQLITPLLLGRQMSINAAVIFLAVVFWGWIWGVAGALMAVPILTTIKVILSYFPLMKPFSNALKKRNPDETKQKRRLGST
jgi:predicted PurR-regulated permease PerM